jgi:hypothetical protein
VRLRFLLVSIVAACALTAAEAPFWETTPPEKWTVAQLTTLLTDSPWAQIAGLDTRTSNTPGLQVYIASAEPIREAEERRRANGTKQDDPSWDEYRDYLRDNLGKYIIVAVFAPNAQAFADGGEVRQMEKDTVLHIGKRKYALVGNFPPSATDPYVRFVFPKDIRPGDKRLTIDMYVPGVPSPWRMVQFDLKEMVFHGRQEL